MNDVTKTPEETSAEAAIEAEALDTGPVSGRGRSRERRCVVTRDRLSEDDLIRFVVDPDGAVVADIAARLPGRGAWVRAERESLEAAVAGRVFARAFKRSVAVDVTLVEDVAARLRQAALSRLGLARREGALAAGFEAVRASIREARPAVVFAARDAAADGRDKVSGLLRAAWAMAPGPSIFDAAEIGAALGRAPTMHVALSQGPHARAYLRDAGRLAGVLGDAA